MAKTYSCSICDVSFDLGKVYRIEIPKIICHKCLHVFSNTLTVRYSHDRVYEKGMRTHVLEAIPFACPQCGTVFRLHEIYCDMKSTENTAEVLETVAREIHPERVEHS